MKICAGGGQVLHCTMWADKQLIVTFYSWSY